MFLKFNLSVKKLVAFVLTSLFFMQQTMILPAIATEITGVQAGADGQYNILPDFVHGDTGFRHYDNFNLSKGDIANLIFALQNGQIDVNKFVNLVDSRIIINGVLNGVLRNGDIGGHAIFVSPQGMVIGASGVLNVGALTTIAPTQNVYDTMKNKYTPNFQNHQTPADPVLNIVNDTYVKDDYSTAQRTDNEQVAFDLNTLKISDQEGNIDVNGKIIARDDVELVGKHIKVQKDPNNPNADKAGILAGVNNNAETNSNMKVNAKLETTEAAGKLFNALVNNDVQNGAGFENQNGKIVIKAQSIKQITNEDVPSNVTEVEDSSLIASLFPKPSDDFVNPDSFENNSSSVLIQDAILKAHDIDVSATTKVEYNAKKGAPSLNYITNPDATTLSQLLTNGYVNWEGARAKATVTIGSGAELIASGDVLLNSLAIATSNIKVKPLKITKKVQIADIAEMYYAVGTQTESSVHVQGGAKIEAGENFVANATSKNTLWAKIKNTTTWLDQAILPNWQVVVLNSTTDADTSAVIDSGATVKAKNVDVQAVNVTNDFVNIAAKTTMYKSDSLPSFSAGVIVRNADIDTEAKVNGNINAAEDVNVNAQNLHVASLSSTASVAEDKGSKLPLPGNLGKAQKAVEQIQQKISGLLGTFIADVAPNASGSVVVNTVNNSASATIGNKADITANKVNVNANIVDLSVNSSTAKTGDDKTASYVPAPGVAVIVNEQNNAAHAQIEDSDGTNSAKIKAKNGLNVSATTEQPMNEATFEFLLSLAQLGNDLVDGSGNIVDGVSSFDINTNTPWDFSGLTTLFTNESGEILADIKDIRLGLKQSGATSHLGLKGFTNNWAQSTSKVKDGGVGLAGSFVYSEVVNDTVARIGNGTQITDTGNVIVNAANKIVQNNAAGDLSKLWKISGSSGESSGVGGSGIVTYVTNNAKAQIGENVIIDSTGDVKLNSASLQSYINTAITGSSTQNGLAFSGSTVVQEINGTTESSVGKGTSIKAKNLDVIAGSASIATATRAKDQLISDPFADRDDVLITDDIDLSTPQVRQFLDLNEDTGLISVDAPSTITDGVSNITITGALANQTGQVTVPSEGGNTGTSSQNNPQSSSGVAVGASVVVSDISRGVQAYIADNTTIELTESLNVKADTLNQELNIAIAGAFAGGVKLKKEKKDTDKNNVAANSATGKTNLLNSWQDKTDNAATKADNLLANANTSKSSSAKLDKNGNPIINVEGKEYTTNDKGQYCDKDGNVLKDKNGNEVKYDGSTGKEASNLDNLDSEKGHSKNMSAAAAGSVNVQFNNTEVKAEIGNADIKVGNDVNVEANQATKVLNVGGGVAKAATVGAGAAVNLIENTNQTTASLKGSQITYTGTSDNKLNVKAEENNDNIQVAIGVGVSKASQDDATTQVSAGGSFNTDILENKVVSQIDGATVKHQNKSNNIAVNIDAENHSTSYKGAGGLSVNTSSSGTGTGGSSGSTGSTKAQSGNTSVGAGMGGNLNLITKETNAKITNSNIQNAKSVEVVANKDKTQKTEDLISVGVGGTVITGAQSGYSFSGAMATDVINNTINANIDNSTIAAANNVNVAANNNFSNGNIAGALGFSTASKGVGVGVGAIVSVINNDINASVTNNSNITGGDVNVNAYNNENLKFLAANMGIQTGNGIPVTANGIVNVIQNNIAASVLDSSITNSGSLDIISDYDNSIECITVAASIAAGSGLAAGANVLSNTLLSSNTAQLINSDTTSSGKLTVKATTDGNIDTIPAAAAISSSGSLAAAANVGVNVVQNSTTAKIDAENGKKSNVSANGVEVAASDNTQSRSRGGVLAASGGTAAVGGSILTDVYLKNVDAHIDNATITKGGDIKVDASAKNIFGEETPGSITAAALAEKLSNPDYDMKKDTDYQNWDMTFDVAGASTAGVSGSLISKNVINDVDAYIGSNVAIQEAGNIDVLASNKTVADVIVGSITAGGTAAVGGSIFSNVNVSTVDAGIKNGAQVGSDSSRVGYVNVNANSEQIYKSMMAIVGGAGAAAVKGSINSNIIVNETNAYVGNGVNIFADRLNVAAADSMDTEALNVAVSAAGSAAVGGAIFTNVLANKVNSIVGKNGTDGQKAGNINTTGDVKVSANDDQNFQANVIVTSAAGAAGVGAVAVANIMASEVNAGIENTTVTSNDSVTITANNSFNGAHKDQNTGLQSLINKGSVSSDDISKLIPLVGVITIGAAGSAGVSATLIANSVTTAVNAYVDNSTISTLKGLNVDADSSMTTYDAALSVAAAGVAGVGVNGVTNIYSGTTIASVTDSTVNGSLNVTADDAFNLNTIIFTTAASGTAAVTAITNVNTISNEVTAKVENTDINDAQTVKVTAKNTVTATDVLAAGAVAGTGAGVSLAPIVNVFTNSTNAYIQGGSVDNAQTTVDAQSDINVISAILGVSGSGVGASVSGFAGVNVFDNELNSYISDVSFTNAQSTSVSSTANLNLDGIIGAIGINGVGASVLVNGIVNVIKNNVNAYIANSSISGGSVSVSAIQNSDIDNTTASIAANGVGAAVSANTLVSVLTNNLNANITKTSTDVDSLTVNANNKQDISNNNIGIGASGTDAAGVNTTVNVLENTAKAYIDAEDNTMNVSGNVSVAAKDEILMQNNLGLVSGSGIGAVGANVNVNVINNAVLAQLLSTSQGQINANSVEVNSNSIIGLDEGGITAAAAGFGAIAGTVFVNSIGGKVSDYSTNANLKDAGIDESITQANNNFNSIVEGITYEKDGQNQTLAGSYNLTSGEAKAGTQAEINANVTTTGADGVKVSAQNTLKGYDSDTMSITNATAAGGTGAAAVGVLVTDMKYNTSASISGGNVVAQNNGDVTVKADSNVKANTDAVATTLTALVGVAGSVAYFDNKANTTAQIINANVNSANDINVLAESSDSIVSKAISASVGGVSVNLNIAVANTENTIQSLISGNNVDIDADNLNVKATNTSRLESELYGASIAGVDVSVVVNTAVSKAVSDALISLNNNSTVDVLNDLNIISQTGGINTINNVVVGSVGVYSADGNYQKAESNATFNSGIAGGKINANNVKINAGTAKDSDEGGNITATVNTKEATGALYSFGTTVVDARANGNANAQITGGNVTAKNKIDIKSKLNRTAKTDSESFSISGLEINALVVSNSTGGDTNINTNGSTLTAYNVDMLASSTNRTSASMVSGKVSLIGGDGTVVEAISGGNAKIETGNINADNTNLKVDIKRNATITKNEKAASLVGLKVTDLKAKTTGTSGINTHGIIQNKAANGQAQKVVINTVDNSVAQNESAETSIGFIEGSVLNIETTSDSLISNVIGGTIKTQTLDIDSTLNRTAVSNAASKDAGLANIGVMNLTSQIGNANTTTISAAIEAENVDVDSTMTSTVESYVHDFSAGLVALAHGATRNKVNDTSKNIVNFNGTINADLLDADINTLSNAYLFKESGNYGLFVVKGGELSNTLKATSELNLNNAKINTKGDALFTVVNNAHTPSEMQVTDDAGGFVVSGGAKLSNTLNIGAGINVNGNTEINAGNKLELDITSGTTGFKQKVTSDGSGFTANNNASSIVTAVVNNNININDGLLSGKYVDINMNSSNELSSIAEVDTHHFAGNPSVNSEVNLTINNTLNVAGELFAQSETAGVNDDTSVNINFMGNSKQDLNQLADLYVEAAIATGDADGGINFTTNNNVNVKNNGVISSQKDINVVFDRGEEKLSSKIVYDRVSRLLFGIKIHDDGSYTSVKNESSNNVKVDGKLIAGKNNSMHLTIDKDGNATGTIQDNLYEKQDSTLIEAGKDSQAAKDEIAKIEQALSELNSEKERLENINETNTANYESLLEQIDALKLQLAMAEYIQGVADSGKISQNDFKNSIVTMLENNNVANAETVANQLLDYYTMAADDKTNLPIYSFNTSDGNNIILKYAVDENGSYIIENGHYKLADLEGYTINYENNIPVSVTPDNSASVISVGTLTFDDYLAGLGIGEDALNSIKTSLDGMKIDSQTATITTDSGTKTVTFLTTGGKIIYDSQYVDNMQSVSSEITAAENSANTLNETISSIADDLNDIKNQIKENEARKDNIAQNGLGEFKAENGSYIFKDINATSGTINIQANKGKSEVSGTGEIIMSLADVLINNYSNYNLIFSDITVAGGVGSFVVDGKTVTDNPYNGITISTIGSADNKGGITINNWYDPNDPDNNTALGVLSSNMIFNGIINTGVGNVNIYNESGDVTINNDVTSNKLTVNVAQGSFTQDTKGKEYVLNSGDTLFAGKNINIIASKIKVEGNMQTGIADKNITITQDMLEHAVKETVKQVVTDASGNPIKDANGNVQYKEVETGRLLVNLALGRDGSEGSKQSDYMYNTNNIKALYDPKTNTVELFGVKVTDEANINLTATSSDADAVYVSDKSSIKYANGYGEINIDNQTNAHLVVNGLENNKIAGAVTVNGSTNLPEFSTVQVEETRYGLHQIDGFPFFAYGEYTVTVEKQAGFGAKPQNTADTTLTNGKTTVDTSKNSTTGDLIVNGLISSGNLTEDEAGLLLQTNGNLVINNRTASEDSNYQVPTIDTKGDIVLNKLTDNGGVLIQGLIQNSGNTTVNNAGADGITLAAMGFIDNENGKVNINNNNGNIQISGKINNTTENDFAGEKDVVITNNSDAGGIITDADSEIKNHNGKVTVTNNGALGINAQGNILATKGDINITNKKGDMLLGEDSLISLNDGYTNQLNNINILNSETSASMTIAGAVNNYGNGNIDIHNKGTGAATIAQTAVVSNNIGNIIVTNENSKLTIAGKTQNQNGDTQITNNGEEGALISGKILNTGNAGTVTIDNTKGNVTISGAVSNVSQTNEDNLVITNDGDGGALISGTVSNLLGNTIVDNTAGAFELSGNMTNSQGNTKITNSGDGGAIISQSGVVSNNAGDILITNNNNKLTIAGTTENQNGNTQITNNGENGALISGTVSNTGNAGKLTIDNTVGGITITNTGSVTNTANTNEDNLLVQNSGDGGISIAGKVVNTNQGNLKVVNNNANSSAITTAAGSLIQNTNGVLNITNEGANGISVAGTVNNIKGASNIVNNNTSDTSAIKIATTGRVTNNDGTITIKNFGTKDVGLDIEGIVNAIKQNIEIINENSDIEIGEYDSSNDFYVNAQNGNIIISQTNGDILNGIVDTDTENKNQNHDLGNKDKAYKTLLSTSGNLTMNVEGGNIGSDTHALDGKESGFGINASTRDYTESINVNVAGVVNANASNNGNALINLRAKDSNLNVNNITSDGNVMLTAVDWKQADMVPAPSDESYYHGYSVVNSATDKSKANVTGRNISVISSDNIGTNGNSFTYNQLEGGSISAMAENDLYIKGMGLNDNIWQLITKRGNMGLEFSGDAVIRELTAGKDLKIVSKGANLTIYDLGKTTNLEDNDDILFPHDGILMSSVSPETVDIRVLDVNPDTRVNQNAANSTLNIYNAYVKGQSNGTPDVTLRADNIIAHAYDAASSPVGNASRPSGFDATEGRLYANDYTDSDAEKNLKATGFNTVGSGSKLVFDIQGVSPDDVVNAGAQQGDRNYKPQEVVETWEIFNNPIGFKDTVYKAKDVTLSLNSASTSPTDNRGMEISKIYTDNAYVDTKDLNMHISDAYVTNYGEFRNGNRGGAGGGHYISDDYRWLTIVDNDYFRNITNLYDIPVTSQLYTKLTGSFGLNMGNVIALETKAPVVHYNPYEVILLPRTENSFYRLTYKDDKIQKTTTTPDFADIDKSTYKPTKRDSIRFTVKQGDGYVNISDKKKKKEKTPRIIAIENISRGGLAVVHDGSLRKGERFVIDIDYHNIKASPEVEVVRVVNDKAGLKFINLDKATANKILYMNMFMADNEETSPQMSQR